ncbi:MULTISPECIES: hypothetical protein [Methylobacterium]|uniref:hypothetical protein n=1 Tax=Methylobacterium TaxID=407 RepID=UPI000AABF56C|nr:MULTISPECIES: hypothetical protein [Methylobacterium]
MDQRGELIPNWLRRRRFSLKAKRLIAVALRRRRILAGPVPGTVATRPAGNIIPFQRR